MSTPAIIPSVLYVDHEEMILPADNLTYDFRHGGYALNRSAVNLVVHDRTSYRTTNVRARVPFAVGNTFGPSPTVEVDVRPTPLERAVSGRLLIIGASITSRPGYVARLYEMLRDDPLADVTMIGTFYQKYEAARHEGRPGWRVSWYNERPDSPFVNRGAFDFAAYLDANGLEPPDWVFVHLGGNDVFYAESGAEIAKKNGDTLEAWLENIRKAPGCGDTRLVAFTYIVASSRFQPWQYIVKKGHELYREDVYHRKHREYAATMIDRFDRRQDEGFYMLALHPYLNDHDFGDTDPMHPAESGYEKIARVFYSFIKNEFQSAERGGVPERAQA